MSCGTTLSPGSVTPWTSLNNLDTSYSLAQPFPVAIPCQARGIARRKYHAGYSTIGIVYELLRGVTYLIGRYW